MKNRTTSDSTDTETEHGPGLAASPCSVFLTDSERTSIAEILDRRSNEIASFQRDLEDRVSEKAGNRIEIYALPGSVELAISREITRLRRIADKVRVPKAEIEDDDE